MTNACTCYVHVVPFCYVPSSSWISRPYYYVKTKIGAETDRRIVVRRLSYQKCDRCVRIQRRRAVHHHHHHWWRHYDAGMLPGCRDKHWWKHSVSSAVAAAAAALSEWKPTGGLDVRSLDELSISYCANINIICIENRHKKIIKIISTSTITVATWTMINYNKNKMQ